MGVHRVLLLPAELTVTDGIYGVAAIVFCLAHPEPLRLSSGYPKPQPQRHLRELHAGLLITAPAPFISLFKGVIWCHLLELWSRPLCLEFLCIKSQTTAICYFIKIHYLREKENAVLFRFVNALLPWLEGICGFFYVNIFQLFYSVPVFTLNFKSFSIDMHYFFIWPNCILASFFARFVREASLWCSHWLKKVFPNFLLPGLLTKRSRWQMVSFLVFSVRPLYQF